MTQRSLKELKAMEKAGTHTLSMISIGVDPYSKEWCVWERDNDGRMLYRAAFATEAEAMAHGKQRLTGAPE